MITLIPQTDQEAFDSVWKQLQTQTKRSASGGCCQYRLETDPHSPVRCAIGGMIRDEDYDPLMEGGSARNLIHDWSIKSTLSPVLLNELQEAHDWRGNWETDVATLVESFRAWTTLRNIAERYDLSVPV